MLRQKRRQDETSPALSAEAEERIREDERRRVLADLGGDHRGDGDDWRTMPPAAGEPRVDDPRDAAGPTVVDDPRRWDVPDAEQPVVAEQAVVAERPVVAERATTVVGAPLTSDVVVERGFSPGQLLLVLAGAAALALGILAVVRTGVDGSLSDPVEPVLGWDHTALLGLIEIGAGAVMLLSGLRAGTRWIGGLVGLAAIAGGALILAELDWTIDELGTERDFGWVPIAIGGVAVLGALIPRVRRTRRS